MDNCLSMTSEETLTVQYPVGKQFRDYIEAPKEDGGDEFVRELLGDLTKVFSSHVDVLCALDLSVLRACYWSRGIPLLGTRRELGEVSEKDTHKTHQCRCRIVEGQRCTEFSLNHTERE